MTAKKKSAKRRTRTPKPSKKPTVCERPVLKPELTASEIALLDRALVVLIQTERDKAAHTAETNVAVAGARFRGNYARLSQLARLIGGLPFVDACESLAVEINMLREKLAP